jgi:2,4-dienoyl-CoA reductase-like NADH-dependent reductase (Old Yellow Enzyme family)
VSRENSMVFSPGRIGPLEIKNRLVRSATFENAATREGEVSDFLVNLYRDLAQGGVGLIITGIAGVYPEALAPPLLMRADDDSFIPSLAKIPRAVREAATDCKVVLQLHHPGRQVFDEKSGPRLMPLLPRAWMTYIRNHPELLAPSPEPHPVAEAISPSAVHDAFFDRTPREVTLNEIERIIGAFAKGIIRAQEAGFHGVQLHGAHGYLLSAFLSPRTNRRDDQYGGATENRTRIVFQKAE